MAAPASLIPEIDEAIARGTPQRRADTLQRMASLFIEGAERLNEDQVALFDDVFGRLIVEIEGMALADLSERLAPVPNAPVGLVRTLARHEEIAVAGPVLRECKRLDEADLVEIARHHGQRHLVAISARSGIPATVTDVLIRRGDHEVVRTAVNNSAARFSETGFAALIQRAGHDDVLAVQVGRRPDIPAPLFRKLVSQATAVVQERLLATARPERQAEVRRVLTQVADQVAARGAQPRDYAAAQETVAALERAGQLHEDELMRIAKAGNLEDTIAALAAFCKVPIDVAERLIIGARPDPVLILCRAMNFQWATVSAILSLRFPSRSPTMEEAQAQFGRLSTATAERVLKFWRARPENPALSA
jgi:uncharacterized protein (DUF2336 family)